jgi:hypothetical protein
LCDDSAGIPRQALTLSAPQITRPRPSRSRPLRRLGRSGALRRERRPRPAGRYRDPAAMARSATGSLRRRAPPADWPPKSLAGNRAQTPGALANVASECPRPSPTAPQRAPVRTRSIWKRRRTIHCAGGGCKRHLRNLLCVRGWSRSGPGAVGSRRSGTQNPW